MLYLLRCTLISCHLLCVLSSVRNMVLETLAMRSNACKGIFVLKDCGKWYICYCKCGLRGAACCSTALTESATWTICHLPRLCWCSLIISLQLPSLPSQILSITLFPSYCWLPSTAYCHFLVMGPSLSPSPVLFFPYCPHCCVICRSFCSSFLRRRSWFVMPLPFARTRLIGHRLLSFPLPSLAFCPPFPRLMLFDLILFASRYLFLLTPWGAFHLWSPYL